MPVAPIVRIKTRWVIGVAVPFAQYRPNAGAAARRTDHGTTTNTNCSNRLIASIVFQRRRATAIESHAEIGRPEIVLEAVRTYAGRTKSCRKEPTPKSRALQHKPDRLV